MAWTWGNRVAEDSLQMYIMTSMYFREVYVGFQRDDL